MNHISKYIGIYREEFRMTVVYSAMAFLLGAFITVFDIQVHANFFEEFNNRIKFISGSYLVSGFIGILLTYIYSLIFHRVSTRRLTFWIFTFVLFFSAIYIVMVGLWPVKAVIFCGMIILFPANTLLLLMFWRYGRNLLYPEQTKRIFPVVQFANMAGIAFGGVIFTGFLYLFEFYNSYYFSLALLFLLWISQFFLNAVHRNSEFYSDGKEKYIPVKNSLFLYFSSKYTIYILLFVFLSALIGFSIHFAFINITWANFTNKIGVSKFYGLFFGALMVFIYGIDKFLIKRILYSYDSPYSLVVIPVIIFAAIALSIGGIFGLIRTTVTAHVTIFFLLLAMSKVGYVASQQTIQLPSMRTLFHSLDIRYRQLAFPMAEGLVVMAGLMASGATILALAFLKKYSLTIVLFLIILYSIFWFWVAIKMIKSYQKVQKEELEKMRFRKLTENLENSFKENLWNILVKNDASRVVEALMLSSRIQPLDYERDLQQLLAHPSEKVRQYIYQCVLNERIVSLLPELKKKSESEKKLNAELISLIQELERPVPRYNSIENIKERVLIGSVAERIELANQIPLMNFNEKEDALLILSKDYDPQVRDASIKNLARLRVKDLSYSLIDFIYPGQYNPYAFDAIASSGDKAVDYLERESMLPGTDNLVLARIFRLLGKIATPKASALLISKMSELDNYLRAICIQALIENKYQALPETRFKLINQVVKLSGLITTNLNTILQLKKRQGTRALTYAYDIEVRSNYNQLFRLLSLLYNSHIVAALRKTFESGSRSEINHTIEITDQYIDNDLRPLIFALIEDLSYEERLKKLDYFFPQFKVSLREIISDTLTHDYNTLSHYPRATAMIYIYENNLTGFEDELIFNADHPHPLLQETALFVLKHTKNPSEEAAAKIEMAMENHRNFVIPGWGSLFYNRITELRNYRLFQHLEEFVGLEIAKTATKIEMSASDVLNIENLSETYYMLFTGNLQSLLVNKQHRIKGNPLIHLGLFRSMGIKTLHAIHDMDIWAFPNDTIFELLHDNTDLANLILQSIDHLKIVDPNEE